ncbi:AB hydrolase superfamily protein B1A11.02 [Pseudocercospora fuligena]|uniref:AB hydrolase superfamily protein B1A11.02 n=1 Tax=Pseudocercospora fuligena TaxID=685502 RepID=A0A8H6VRD9_9PEZI|nr:AB hydrolase superfamily protein B1A11.02 [Pseudocercospora fuligena]
MAQIQDWQSLGKLDPEWEEAVKVAGGSPDLGAFPDIQTLQNFMLAAKANQNSSAGAGSLPGVSEKDHQVEMRDGHKIAVRTYHPESPPASGSPLSVVYHGGGWCLGDLSVEELLCRLLASKLGMTVANIDYRLAPEWKFPYAINDCYDATKWASQVAANASTLGADPSQGFIIGGTSAGGNIACAISHLWRDNKDSPPVTGAHLMIPAVCDASHFPEELKADHKSWDDLELAPILSRKACDLFMGNYIPKVEDRGDPLFAPLLWPTGHKNLPPQYFQIDGADPLRDEALIYERILREKEGVTTKVDVYPGQPHGFNSIFPQMKASKKWHEDSVQGVKWLLEQNWKP